MLQVIKYSESDYESPKKLSQSDIRDDTYYLLLLALVPFD